MHAPFHVIDGKNIITVIDNPLIKDGRIASLYAIDGSPHPAVISESFTEFLIVK